MPVPCPVVDGGRFSLPQSRQLNRSGEPNRSGELARNRGRNRWAWAAMLLVLLIAAAAPLGGSPALGQSPLRATQSAGTAVELPPALQQLYEEGGTPQSQEQLLALERLQQQVAQRVGDCTVNVAIGPAQGSGVIVTADGYILTAAHVATRPGKSAIITFRDGRKVTATTLGLNRSVDAGLLKIDSDPEQPQNWPHASLGTSDRLKPGMWCLAVGHPGGFDAKRGTVTRIGRILSVRRTAIVTDCALIGGDSGGPLFDISGRLIAVHSRIGNDVADNLHVPIDHYDRSWDRLAAGEAWGYLEGFRPILGVRGNPDTSVAEISEVNPGSPAEAAGLKPGDIVERFGDVEISDFQSLRVAVADTMPGERLRCLIRRGDRRFQLTVEIGRE